MEIMRIVTILILEYQFLYYSNPNLVLKVYQNIKYKSLNLFFIILNVL